MFSERYFRQRSTVLLVLVAPLVAATLLLRPLDPIPIAIGVAFALAGAGLRLASMRCIGRGARVHRAGVRGQLVTWGPYGVSRNPLYLAAALILVGLGFVSGLGAWSLLLLPAAVVLYTPVVLHEERAIEGEVGEEFVDYRGRVSRWFGLPGGDPPPPEPVPWGEVLSRETWLVPGVLAAVGGILLIRTGTLPLTKALDLLVGARVSPAIVGVVVLFLGAVGNALVVESKRRRRLRRDALREREAAGERAALPGEPNTSFEGSGALIEEGAASQVS